jgi:1,4-dihydroxy-2-naphthoate octaprenyltransferase
MLLFLNEFPDADVDRAAGRRHVVILLGRKNAAFIYVSCLVATYVSIVLSVVAKAAPFPVLVSLATVPIAYKASKITLKNYDKISELIPALGANVLMILSTISLLAAGFTIGYFIGL